MDIDHIKELTPESIKVEHFLELGGDMVDALRGVIGDDALKQIYLNSKGENSEGFGERFSGKLQDYIDSHGELFEEAEEKPVHEFGFEDNFKLELGANLDEMRKHYVEMRDTHLSRNIFVSWEKLRVDVAARQNDEVGADGKYKVSGGTIAVDILGIIRGNIFETIIESVVRHVLDSLFPAEPRDAVTREETAEKELETDPAGAAELLTSPVDFIDTEGVRDNGLIERTGGLIERDVVDTMRSVNPDYGRYFGFDVMGKPYLNGSMQVFSNDWMKQDTVVGGNSQRENIPGIRMAELEGNHYHVSPFGKILNSDIQNPRTELAIGSTIRQLDFSTGRREPFFEAMAANQGVSLDTLKEQITGAAMDRFVERIDKGLEASSTYLSGTAIPEAESTRDSFRRDLFILDSREAALSRELDGLREKPDVTDQQKELEGKLDRIRDLKGELEKGLSACGERIERLQTTLERYEECKQELAAEDGDSRSRYMAASNTEKEARGRTNNIEYMPSDVDREVSGVVRDEWDAMRSNVERYNEENPDNTLHEKDGEYYNRFGISESGKYDPDMCDPTEKPETDAPSDIDEFTKVHEDDGFSEFKEQLENRVEPIEPKEAPDTVEEAVGETDATGTEELQTDQQHDTTGNIAYDEPPADAPVDAQQAQQEALDGPEEGIDAKEIALPSSDRDKAEKAEGGFDGDITEAAVDAEDQGEKSADSTDQEESLKLHPMEAAQPQETEAATVASANGEEIPKDSDGKEKKKEEKQDEEEDTVDAFTKISDGFDEYLDNDTYSFGGDLAGGLEVSFETENLMVDALCQRYLSTDNIPQDRLHELTMEVATYSDRGIMVVIEELAVGLKEGGMNDFEVAQTLRDMEGVVCSGIDDLMYISHDEVDQRTLCIGDESWIITDSGITNAITGVSEDPNSLVSLISDAVDRKFGDGLGDTATQQVLDNMKDLGLDSSSDLEFLDRFFDGTMESVLHHAFEELLPENMRDMVVEQIDSSDDLQRLQDNAEFRLEDQFENGDTDRLYDDYDPGDNDGLVE